VQGLNLVVIPQSLEHQYVPERGAMQVANRKNHCLFPAGRVLFVACALAAVGSGLTYNASAAERSRAFGGPAGPVGPRGFAAPHATVTAADRYLGRPFVGRPGQSGGRGFERGPSEPLRLGGNPGGPLARNGLPHRLFPGEAGFTGVPPRGETRFVSDEMIVHVGADVSPQTLGATARRLGLTLIDSQQLAFTNGTLAHFRIANSQQVADAVRAARGRGYAGA
jgi:hypothetical protein